MISTFKSLKKHKYLVLALYDSIFLLHSPIVFSALARDLPFIYLQKWPKKNNWILKLFFNVKRSLCTSCCHSSPWNPTWIMVHIGQWAHPRSFLIIRESHTVGILSNSLHTGSVPHQPCPWSIDSFGRW